MEGPNNARPFRVFHVLSTGWEGGQVYRPVMTRPNIAGPSTSEGREVANLKSTGTAAPRPNIIGLRTWCEHDRAPLGRTRPETPERSLATLTGAPTAHDKETPGSPSFGGRTRRS
jgi:hypothetical protein